MEAKSGTARKTSVQIEACEQKDMHQDKSELGLNELAGAVGGAHKHLAGVKYEDLTIGAGVPGNR
jgi:hypothetical protein